MELEVLARDDMDSAEALRQRGTVPAVLYGPKEKTMSVAINARKLEQLWKAAGETSIVTLKGVGEDKTALIHDAQFHPITGALLHVDFYIPEKGKKVEIEVPLEFTGVAPAEKSGHILVKTLHELEIKVDPLELPHSLTVDLSKLENVGDHIVARDIALPPSAELITNAEEIVASVKEFKEEAEEIAPAPETAIIGEEKKAEGAEGESAEVKPDAKEGK